MKVLHPAKNKALCFSEVSDVCIREAIDENGITRTDCFEIKMKNTFNIGIKLLVSSEHDMNDVKKKLAEAFRTGMLDISDLTIMKEL